MPTDFLSVSIAFQERDVRYVLVGGLAVPQFGRWQDAEALRKWSFLQRTPQQRLDWLIAALTIAYQCGALKTRTDVVNFA